MAVYSYLLLTALAAVAYGAVLEKRAFDQLYITPCAQDNSLVTLNEVKITPYPPVLPGTLSITVKGSLNKDMPKLYIKAKITKVFFGGSLRTEIPCISGYGSCVYDICDVTKGLSTCPDDMLKYNIPCTCPFTKFSLGNFQESYTVASIPALLDWLKNGDYEVKAEVLESPTGPALACFDIKTSLVSKGAGIDCNNPLYKYGNACKDVLIG